MLVQVGLVALLTALACLNLYALETESLQWVKADPVWLGLFGFACISVVMGLTSGAVVFLYASRRTSVAVKAMTGFFLMTVWSAAIDTFLALSLVGYSPGNLGLFYHVSGEKYFKCSWGFGALIWDGSGHWAMQGIVASKLVKTGRLDDSSLFWALVWAGSVLNSMPVLLLGAATGPFSDELELSTALNAPYVIVPTAIAIHCLTCTSESIKERSSYRILEILLGTISLVVYSIRAMVVLGSKAPIAKQWAQIYEPVLFESSGFLNVQVMQDFFIFGLWILVRACLGFCEHSVNLARVSFLLLGCALQSQVCWLLMVLYRWEDFELKDSGFRTNVSIAMPFFFVFSSCCQVLFNSKSRNKKKES